MNIKGQSFLKLLDFTPEQIAAFLTLAADLKAKKKAGIPHRLCEGKQAALIFEKTSTRTRCSFEVAAHDLGMTVTYLATRPARRLAKRNPLQILRACLAVCTTALSTAATGSRSSRSWQNTRASPSGTD